MPIANTNQLNPHIPMNQSEDAVSSPPLHQASALNAAMVHQTNLYQQQAPAIAEMAELFQLNEHLAMQQNLATTGSTPIANTNELNPRIPMNQPEYAVSSPPSHEAAASNATMVHQANLNIQQAPAIAETDKLSQLEAARQQNLLKIQQLKQALEVAQQKELQFKAAHEQQQQQIRQQQRLERQDAIRQLWQQLQHQEQHLDQAIAQHRYQQQLEQAQATAQQQQQGFQQPTAEELSTAISSK